MCSLVDISDEQVDLTIFLIFNRNISNLYFFQFLLFLMFEGLLFALFTSIMFGTQVSAIWYDETAIESLKKEETRWVRKSRWKSIQAVFGRFSIYWFSPFTPAQLPGKNYGYLFSV